MTEKPDEEQIDKDFAFARDMRNFRALIEASSLGEPDPDPEIEAARQWMLAHPPGARLPEELEP